MRGENNLVQIIVTSSDEGLHKTYTIDAYRRTREESEKYNQNQEIDREKVKQILGDFEDIDENYLAEKTNIEINYKSNNKNIKIGILSFILIILIIGILIKYLNEKK